MQNLSNDMKNLVQRIETVLVERAAHADPHWTTCKLIADEFELWEETADGDDFFPLWLSYVVQGIGRDKGILD